ncbi:MAG: nucleoside triphosphate pyrophosphohydrolase [Gammaproteobacteria bacterium]|nr:MAG: nucleoside triphosphate pyrophosphohydrolase [Gammaproteobacteria bacterium]
MAAVAIERLLGIMARLRDPAAGCPWDRAQDFRSIAPHTLEEAFEVVDAIERQDLEELRGELGDLLFQVVFHARIAEEQGAFDFGDVVAAIAGKLERRHPHVFGGEAIADAGAQARAWEQLKAEERSTRGLGGTLDGIPLALPALTRARKLGRRAAATGFDWPDASGPRAKIIEELAELDQARAEGGDRSRLEAELGDLLFSVVNLARHLELDPETALRGANARFAARFARVEEALAARGLTAGSASPELLDTLWTEAKRAAP